MQFISSFLLIFFFTNSCNGGSKSPLTRKNIRAALANPSENQPRLNPKTYEGCESVPAKNFFKKKLVGFDFTGETCSVTVHSGNTVSVSFIDGDPVPVKILSGTDIYVGELGNNQVLIVQHTTGGEVVSVTQTIYDSEGNVVYGKSGEGDSIKECLLHLQGMPIPCKK